METHFPGGEGNPTQIVVSADKADLVTAAIKNAPGVSEIVPLLDGIAVPGQPLPKVKIVNNQMILNVTLDKAPTALKPETIFQKYVSWPKKRIQLL